jgi:hypothetical protein
MNDQKHDRPAQPSEVHAEGDVPLGVFDTQPHAVTNGVTWYVDHHSNDYARSIGLRGYHCWGVQFASGERAFVITDGWGVVFESKQLEGIGCHLDMLRAAEVLR